MLSLISSNLVSSSASSMLNSFSRIHPDFLDLENMNVDVKDNLDNRIFCKLIFLNIHVTICHIHCYHNPSISELYPSISLSVSKMSSAGSFINFAFLIFFGLNTPKDLFVPFVERTFFVGGLEVGCGTISTSFKNCSVYTACSNVIMIFTTFTFIPLFSLSLFK